MTPVQSNTVARLFLVGIGAGVVGGGLGVGGGIILVPLLLGVVGLDRHRAHATSLAAIILIALAGAVTFAVNDSIDYGLGLAVAAGGISGSVVGANVMHRISARSLAIGFAIVLVVAGSRMVLGAHPIEAIAAISGLGAFAIAAGIGLLAGFVAGVTGVGGGVVIVPGAVLLLGLVQQVAQGTSLMAITATSAAATWVNLRNHRVDLKEGLTAGAGGVLGAVVGAALAVNIDSEILARWFGVLVLLVAARTIKRVYFPTIT